MKRINLIVAAAAIFLAAGCAKEEIHVPQNEDGTTVLTAGISSTKTVLDGLKVYWTDGDKIAVNGVVSEALELSEPAEKGIFSFNSVLDAPYKAVFPASIYKDGTTVTLPSLQATHESSFAADAAPMAAYVAAGETLTFSHLCAVIKLTINYAATENHTADHAISYVEVRGNKDEQMCGDFTIDYSGEKPLLTAAGKGESVRVTVGRTPAQDASVVVHVVVPAGEYAEGFTVKVADASGHYMEKSTGSSRTLAAGEIRDMTAFDFVPDKTEVNVEITSAAELLAFANAWNAGDYASADAVAATVMNDFAFSDTDNTEWTTGIGTEENKFDGTFDGNGCTISGFASAAPVFTYTETDAVIKDVNISGSVTYTLSNETEQYISPFIAYNRGLVSACNTDVDVIVKGISTANVCLGGLAGYMNNGEVIGCTATGNMAVDASYNIMGDFHLGGIVGYVNSNTALISDSRMSGYMQYLGTAGDSDKNSNNGQDLYMGGIVGYTKGVVEKCVTENNPAATDGTFSASILASSSVLYRTQIGGIIGYAGGDSSVSGCVGKASVLTHIYRNNDASLYSYVAGIAGRCAGSMTDCSTVASAEVSVYSAEKNQNIGGIIGECSGTVRNCVNNAPVVTGDSRHETNKSGRNPYVGGVVGYATSAAVIENIQNTANVTIGIVESSQYAKVSVGGCVGKNEAVIIGNDLIVNSGAVSWTSTNTWENTTGGINVGGVIGSTTASVSGLKNKGIVSMTETELYASSATNAGSNLYMGGIVGQTMTSEAITVASCINEGEVDFNQSGTLRKYTNICLGGILGYNASATAVTVNTCENKGLIKCLDIGDRANSSHEDKQGSKYLGGIAGYIQGTSIISGCINSGIVNNADDNNSTSIDTAPGTGGIAGRILGVEGAVAVISNCEVTAAENAYLNASRGWIGGIVGYCQYGEVSGCENNIPKFSGSAYYYGGLCGQLNNSNMKNSSCSTSLENIATSTLKYAGGLVGSCSNTANISDCSFKGGISSVYSSSKKGAFAGRAAGESVLSIKNCKFAGSIDGEEVTADGLDAKSVGSTASDATVNLEGNSILTE